MAELPLVHRKIMDIIREIPTDRKATIESELVRRFRLNKEDCREILRDCETRGLVKSSKFVIKV